MHRTLSVIGVLAAVAVGAFGLWYFATPQTPPGEAVGDFHPLRGTSSAGSREGFSRYESVAFGFSLEYPDELFVREYDEGGGSATLLFQKPEEQIGFQIFVTPYSATEITEDRLRKDIKSGVMNNPQEVVIGKDSMRALIFESEAPIIGKSREVWFIHDGRLYEVTTYAALDTWIAEILTTLDFK